MPDTVDIQAEFRKIERQIDKRFDDIKDDIAGVVTKVTVTNLKADINKEEIGFLRAESRITDFANVIIAVVVAILSNPNKEVAALVAELVSAYK